MAVPTDVLISNAKNAAARERRELRDKFAMAALSGLLAYSREDGDDCSNMKAKDVAETAYDYADAMLEAREKQ